MVVMEDNNQTEIPTQNQDGLPPAQPHIQAAPVPAPEVLPAPEPADNPYGTTAEMSDGMMVEQTADTTMEEDQANEMTELEKYWKAVQDNPSDFTGWTYLLQYVEQEIKDDDLTAARAAFDAFLAKYPYCYGYWKKYADLEKKYNNDELALKVFEYGLHAIPLSIDLWTHYISFISASDMDEAQKEAKTRELYERAIAADGLDFRSDKLWEAYINFEKEYGNPQKVMALYDRLLTIPTQLYSHNFDCFSEHVNSNTPKDILSLDEFLQVRKDVVASQTAITLAETPVADDVDTSLEAEAPPGVEVPPGVDAPPGMDGDSFKGSDEETRLIRERIIEIRRVIHKRTEEEVSKRWTFEEGIRRPYFHVKPLERAQLKNWKDYLDFEIETGNHERIVMLFERCMVACALYEEFWLKYAKYMETINPKYVESVFRRACQIHLPKKPNIHMAWAAFEERQRNFDASLQILRQLEEDLPGLAMVTLRRIGLERRQGKFQVAEELYQSYIDATDKAEVKSFYAIKYARHLSKIIGNIQKAKSVLEEALARDKTNHKLYLQLIDLEYLQSPIDEAAMVRLFDLAITSDLAIEHTVAFSQRKLEFLEDFSSNVSKVLEAYEEHQKLVKEYQSNAQKKRKPEEIDYTEYAPEKKAKKEVSATNNGTANGSPDTILAQQHQAATTAAMSTNTHAQQAVDPNAYYNNQWAGYGGYNYGWNAYNQGYYGQ